MSKSSTSEFEKLVGGKVTAEFDLKGSTPAFVKDGDLKHYRVKLSLPTDNPKVANVVYKLDPSYFDSVRECDDANENYAVDITTYGDYPLRVEVQVDGKIARTKVQLSDLLKASHGDDDNSLVRVALADVAEN